MIRLGLLASHGGSNLQAILDACREGRLPMTPAVVIGNNSKAFALERAAKTGVPVLHLSSFTHPDPEALDAAIEDALVSNGAELVALAGYMKKLGPRVLARYRNRILNIHPALLPKHGGPGMYGLHVHEDVLRSGEAVTGVTVHLVDELYDHGPILAQTEVPVLPGDAPETLQARVLGMEHRLYVETLVAIAQGEIRLPALAG